MTCFEINYVVLQHPKFQLYVEKLVQAELVFYDYFEEIAKHRAEVRAEKHKKMLANIAWSVFVVGVVLFPIGIAYILY